MSVIGRKPRVIVDCDPGHDDVFALATAAMLCDVVAITAVAGNSPLHNTERNARVARDLLGLDGVPVHSGATQPLAGPTTTSAVDAHGRTGLDVFSTTGRSAFVLISEGARLLLKTLQR